MFLHIICILYIFPVLNFVQMYKNLQSSDGVVPEIIIFE